MYARTEKTWFGHPRGVFLVAFAELWERFSYFGIAALLVLYLTAGLDDGGWGWTRSDAILFFGFYTGLVFVVPVLGGWIANNYLGERRCILTGGLLLMLGHLLLGGPAFLPPLIHTFTGVDGQSLIVESGVSMGRLWALGEALQPLRTLVTGFGLPAEESRRLYQAAAWTYVSSGASFLFGLACIVMATGLFKTSISSIVGKLYRETDARRDVGYAMFFTCIYVGAVLANIIAGSIGERYGWHFGFATATAGVAVALIVYLAKERELLGDIGREPDSARWKLQPSSKQPLTREERDRLFVVVAQGLFTIIYAAAFYQKGGLLLLYTRDHVDRILFGTVIPATWFLNVSIIVFMLAAPTLAALFMKLARRARNPSASYKLAIGLGLLGISYLLLGSAEAARLLENNVAINALWLIAAYVLFGLGDALVWPNQMALATKLAPRQYAVLTVGAWYLTVGFGTWLAGLIGMTVERAGNLQLFWGLAVLCFGAGVAVAALTPAMLRMMHGEEDAPAVAADSFLPGSAPAAASVGGIDEK